MPKPTPYVYWKRIVWNPHCRDAINRVSTEIYKPWTLTIALPYGRFEFARFYKPQIRRWLNAFLYVLSPAREPVNTSATLGSVASLGFGANDSAKITFFILQCDREKKINMLLKVWGSADCIREVATRLSTKIFNFLRNFDNKINYSTINCKIKSHIWLTYNPIKNL